MPDASGLRFREAGPGDAHAITGLHADSWQRHYRGAYSDAFLDNDATGYLLPLWTERLAIPDPPTRTILAEHDGEVVGLAHTILGGDTTWGAFLDNLHVAHRLKGKGSAPGCWPGRRRPSWTSHLNPACICGSLSKTATPAPSTPPGEIQAGVALYAGDQVLPFGDRLLAVPISALWEL